MLVEIWEKVLTALEGGKNSVVLLGVDYEKAFNRMDQVVCLEQLQLLRASLVRSFLEGRAMTIDIAGCKTAPVDTDRGSPQGSVLGCFLYCATTTGDWVELRWMKNGTMGHRWKGWFGLKRDPSTQEYHQRLL